MSGEDSSDKAPSHSVLLVAAATAAAAAARVGEQRVDGWTDGISRGPDPSTARVEAMGRGGGPGGGRDGPRWA